MVDTILKMTNVILELVKCNCKSGNCSTGTNCSCQTHGVVCTDLCGCSSTCDNEDIPLCDVNMEDELEEGSIQMSNVVMTDLGCYLCIVQNIWQLMTSKNYVDDIDMYPSA